MGGNDTSPTARETHASPHRIAGIASPDGRWQTPTSNAAAALGAPQIATFPTTALAPDGSILVARSGSDLDPTAFGTVLRVSRLFRDDSPIGQLNAKNLATRREASYRFVVQYHDDDGINLTTLGDDGITVALPGGGGRRKARLVSTDAAGTPKLVNATYLVTSPDGVWDFTDNGTYTVRLERRSGRDINGNAAAQRSIGSFQVLIPPDVVGSIRAIRLPRPPLPSVLDPTAMTPTFDELTAFGPA